MTLGTLPARGRRAAEALMTDECVITRAGAGDPVFDDETGQYVYPDRVVVYTGKCKLQAPALVNPIEAQGPDARRMTEQSVLSLPVTADPAKNDVAEFTSAAFDPALPGRKFTIIGPHHESQATARRVQVVEVTG